MLFRGNPARWLPTIVVILSEEILSKYLKKMVQEKYKRAIGEQGVEGQRKELDVESIQKLHL